MFKKALTLSVAVSLLFNGTTFAADGTIAVTPGTGATIVTSPDGSGNQIPHSIQCDRTTPTQCANYDSGGAAKIQAPPTLPLPAGAADSAKQVTANTSLGNIDTSTAAINTVSGAKTDAKSTATDGTSISFMQVFKQISASIQAAAASLVTLVTNTTGLATSSNQTTANGSLATIATNSAAPIPAQVGVTVNIGNVGGVDASGASVTGQPVLTGGRAQNAAPTAVTNGQAVGAGYTLDGKAITAPYANPENFISGAITSAMTVTTSTSLIAAPAAGLRNYITNCVVSNAHATVGTDIAIQDGSGGTTLYTLPAAPGYGGASITFPTPLRQPTTATAIFVANVTTGASTKASCSGYKGV